VTFYEGVAREFSLDFNEKTCFDCRKIMIAPDILKRWSEEFAKQYGKMALNELYCMILQSGPKVDETLNEREVRLQKGFLSEPTQEHAA